jgi:hypothetical protein
MVEAGAGQILRLQPTNIPLRESTVDSFAHEDDPMTAHRHVGEDIQEEDSFADSPIRMNRLGFGPAQVTSAGVASANTRARDPAPEEDDYDWDLAAEMEAQEAAEAAAQFDLPQAVRQGQGKANVGDSAVGISAEITAITEEDVFGVAETAANPRYPSSQRTTPAKMTALSGIPDSASRHAPARLAVHKSNTPVKSIVYPWSKEVVQKLRQVFGLTNFRENQKDIINATMAGKDGQSNHGKLVEPRANPSCMAASLRVDANGGRQELVLCVQIFHRQTRSSLTFIFAFIQTNYRPSATRAKPRESLSWYPL